MTFARAAGLASLTTALLAGCVTVDTSDSAPPADRHPVGEAHPCNADGTRQFIGQTATAPLGAQIQQATGATIFQWVPPDTAVTMDYRPDRVRVTYDRAMTITAIHCG